MSEYGRSSRPRQWYRRLGLAEVVLVVVAVRVAYVIGLSVLYSASVLLVDSILQLIRGGHFLGDAAVAFPVTAAVTAPLAAVQLATGMLAVGGLSVRRFFLASALLIVPGSAVLTLADHFLSASILYVLGVIGGMLVNPTLVLAVPLLVVVLARRRGAAAGSSRAPICDEMTPTDGAGSAKYRVVLKHLRGRWYRWDIGLAVLPLWFGVLFDPFGLLSYYGGLVNAPLRQGLLCISVMLMPGAAICLVVLVVRILFVWPRHFRSWSRTVLVWFAVMASFGFFFVLPFARFPNQMDVFMSGFQTHVKMRTDIGAIQTWLATVDPGDLEKEARRDNWDLAREAYRLAAIARLKPSCVHLRLDERGCPMIRLSWGTGILGSWGLVVGAEDMETPPSDTSRYGEYRFECAKGAYLWYELS